VERLALAHVIPHGRVQLVLRRLNELLAVTTLSYDNQITKLRGGTHQTHSLAGRDEAGHAWVAQEPGRQLTWPDPQGVKEEVF
jgi:hypothetical protein